MDERTGWATGNIQYSDRATVVHHYCCKQASKHTRPSMICSSAAAATTAELATNGEEKGQRSSTSVAEQAPRSERENEPAGEVPILLCYSTPGNDTFTIGSGPYRQTRAVCYSPLGGPTGKVTCAVLPHGSAVRWRRYLWEGRACTTSIYCSNTSSTITNDKKHMMYKLVIIATILLESNQTQPLRRLDAAVCF